MARPRERMDERFWRRVHKTSDCWLWTGGKTRDGYGVISKPGRGGKSMGAHKYSALLHFGMFDSRLQVLHHCDTPNCVRPEHLYLGTHGDNMRDKVERGRVVSWNASKTHCKHGHEFTPENTYDNGRQRRCRACDNERGRRARATAKTGA